LYDCFLFIFATSLRCIVFSETKKWMRHLQPLDMASHPTKHFIWGFVKKL
jgi:hypothetical protein